METLEERTPPHHHPFDDCDGCRRTQEIIFNPSSEIYKKAYFQVIEEMVRNFEADPSQGTFKQYFVDYMKSHPKLWEGNFIELLN